MSFSRRDKWLLFLANWNPESLSVARGACMVRFLATIRSRIIARQEKLRPQAAIVDFTSDFHSETKKAVRSVFMKQFSRCNFSLIFISFLFSQRFLSLASEIGFHKRFYCGSKKIAARKCSWKSGCILGISADRPTRWNAHGRFLEFFSNKRPKTFILMLKLRVLSVQIFSYLFGKSV